MVGNPKSFSNVNGLDNIASSLKVRNSIDDRARASISIRRESRAGSQAGGATGPLPPGVTPDHLKGVDPEVLRKEGMV